MAAWVTDERSSRARACGRLADGRQAYASPAVGSHASTARAAEQEADALRAGELKGFRVGCMHGR